MDAGGRIAGVNVRAALLQTALRVGLDIPIDYHRCLPGSGRRLASRVIVGVRRGVHAHGGNSSAIASATVTSFTGFVASRTDDVDGAAAAVGAADEAEVDVGAEVDVEAG